MEPVVSKITLPGFCAIEVLGKPPGKSQANVAACVAPQLLNVGTGLMLLNWQSADGAENPALGFSFTVTLWLTGAETQMPKELRVTSVRV